MEVGFWQPESVECTAGSMNGEPKIYWLEEIEESQFQHALLLYTLNNYIKFFRSFDLSYISILNLFFTTIISHFLRKYFYSESARPYYFDFRT